MTTWTPPASQAGTAGDTPDRWISLRFLSREWLEERHRLAWTAPSTLSDVTIRIQHVVLNGPDGTVRYYDDVVDGRLASSGLGDIDSPTVTVTNQWSDELGVLQGRIDPADILIAGRVMVEGDQQHLLLIVPALISATAANWLRIWPPRPRVERRTRRREFGVRDDRRIFTDQCGGPVPGIRAAARGRAIQSDLGGLTFLNHAHCSAILRDNQWGRGAGAERARGKETHGQRRSFLRQDPPEHTRLRALVPRPSRRGWWWRCGRASNASPTNCSTPHWATTRWIWSSRSTSRCRSR